MARTISKLELKNINKQDVIINGFELSEKIKEAKISIQDYQDFMCDKVDVNYESDIWIFQNLSDYRKVKFNFKKINELLKFNYTVNKRVLYDSIKCWIAKELSEKTLCVVSSKFVDLLSVIQISNGFDTCFEDKIIEHIRQFTFYKTNKKNEIKEYRIFTMITSIISFLKFYDGNNFSSLIGKLINLKTKYKYETDNRSLPDFKDVLKFKFYIDEWIKSALERNKKEEILKFYPLVLWWRLTMIIPMRPLELSKIKRNCLSSKEGRYFITFPRFKFHRKGKHRTEITYDTLPIPVGLYQTIRHYISLTSRNQDVEFLIDHKTYKMYTAMQVESVLYKKERSFTNSNLARMIYKFYVEVINLEYKVNFSVKDEIYGIYHQNECIITHETPRDTIKSILRPGDLRHLAIINMMMQGYDKVEIERVAGHFTEDSQFNYYNHMGNWLDVEISKIGIEMAKVSFESDSCDENNLVIHPKVNDFLDSLYKQSYINKGRDKDFSDYIKLEIGHCKDETMPCPTFNFKYSGCYFCKHWTISQSELETNRKIISEDANLIYEELKGKVNFMKALLNAHLDEFGNVYTNTKKDLSCTASEIRMGINSIAKLKVMLGVESYE